MLARTPAKLVWFLGLTILVVLFATSATSEGVLPRSSTWPFGWPWRLERSSKHPKCALAPEQRQCQDELKELRALHADAVGANPVASSGESDSGQEAASLALHAPPHASDAGVGRRLLEDVNTYAEMRFTLKLLEKEIAKASETMAEIKEELKKLTKIKALQDYNISLNPQDFSRELLTDELMADARALISKCNGRGFIVSHPVPTWKGYFCSASTESIDKYLAYPDRGTCPDDWFHTQDMIFLENCHALPKRRCLTLTSPTFREPMPFPESLFDQEALIDENVRWTKHEYKSFNALNTRVVGDCRNCFIMELEKHRWRRSYRGSLPMEEVIAMKKGSIRIGLDAGGGSGSFAAHMALYGVTVMTTAMNMETLFGRTHGLPYMEAIALRGLIPLHVPHKARLPLSENTLDIIHCVNSIKYLPMLEFEELIYEWDRVLRVGGVMWFEMFYAPLDEMPIYVALIEQLGYKKLHWNVMPKPDEGERDGLHVYLNCIIEKPVRKERSGWFGL